MTAADVRDVGKRLSNWGRWGDDDQIGTLNFIGEAEVKAALSLPQRGRVISCAIDFNADGPMPDRGRYNPRHLMVETGAGMNLPGGFCYADDVLEMSLQSATQWDGLSHVHYDGQMYNGKSSSLITSFGAGANAITEVCNGIVGRAVLLDIARLKGRDYLEPGTSISPEDLDECASQEGVEIRTGDIVMVRTGTVGRAVAAGAWESSFVFGPSAGLAFECADWLHTKEVAAVACDNVAVEVMPGPITDCLMPLHMVCLRDIGLTFGEIFNLDPMAEACAASGTYEALLTAPPLPITGAVGSPVNPLVIV
jgi:kynurenine formamidase